MPQPAGGESLFVIGKVLGHANASMTERYAHADDPVRAAADRISGRIATSLRHAGADDARPAACSDSGTMLR